MCITIKIKDVISSESASTPEFGNKLYSELKHKLNSITENDAKILKLDFSEISNITSAFLNNAIGKLFTEYPKTFLINKLRFEGITTLEDFNIIKLTINNAIMMSKYNDKTNKK